MLYYLYKRKKENIMTQLRKLTQEEINNILEEHNLWICSNREKGKRADFSNTNLQYADLSKANLYDADLQRADLRYADLQRADLQRAVLEGANLKDAELEGVKWSKTS